MVSKLLVYIIFHRKKALTVQELCEVLWQEGGSDNPAGALKNLVYRLRMCLKKIWGDYEFIITGRGTYQWNPEINLEVDAEAFEYWKKKGNAAKDDNEKIYCLRENSFLSCQRNTGSRLRRHIIIPYIWQWSRSWRVS